LPSSNTSITPSGGRAIENRDFVATTSASAPSVTASNRAPSRRDSQSRLGPNQ
jgi:hypothetical protein